jgi:radical SAM superfamily enzyme YgiQ (UPF0313 family)
MSKKRFQPGKDRILLALLPFWDPQIPPVGLACLKGSLRAHGYETVTTDANIEGTFRGILDRYFEVLKSSIPPDRQGNLYKIGHEVLRNHMMAHINYKDRGRYLELVNVLVERTFFWRLSASRVSELEEIVTAFYPRLEAYMRELLNREQPALLGLSVFSGTLPASLYAFRLTRRYFPHVRTLMGGGIFADQLAPGTPELDYFLEVTANDIDALVAGEGELLLPVYLTGGLPAGPRLYTAAHIGDRYLDLNRAPLPDYSEFDLQHYMNLSAYCSRSCPFQCSFCSEVSMWGKFRKKTAPEAATNLEQLSRTYGMQLFLMGDSLMNPVITDLSRELLGRDTVPPVYWDGFLRVDPRLQDEETAFLWRRAGFYRARIGCESGSQTILEAMGKKITVEEIKHTVSMLASVGIKTTTMWVVGYPGESERDFQQTLALIEELKDDIYEADCTPFYYFLKGQPHSSEWRGKYRSVQLYPEDDSRLLVTRTWELDAEPNRGERYRRLNRFEAHLRRLGIPNPYTLRQIHEADERWMRLKKNAVPPLLEFKKGAPVKECRGVKCGTTAEIKNLRDLDFGF